MVTITAGAAWHGGAEQHAPHLPVPAFPEDDPELRHWTGQHPKHLRLRRFGDTVVEGDPLTQLRQVGRSHAPSHHGDIFLGDVVSRVRQPVGEIAVVGKE
ncbi:MAG: hypothetical protein AUI15_05450 [Actinobacteria bacterium 13_2_20CM_2_66_6]|nr:MAG: hypothetical protein AUI15_05450 [Actinobacteria bacterium 13_2_20CM_2_66_6]